MFRCVKLDILGVKLEESTAKRLDEYWELFADVHYGFDAGEQEAGEKPMTEHVDEKAIAKERLAVFWGAISNEVYVQCKTAIELHSR